MNCAHDRGYVQHPDGRRVCECGEMLRETLARPPHSSIRIVRYLMKLRKIAPKAPETAVPSAPATSTGKPK